VSSANLLSIAWLTKKKWVACPAPGDQMWAAMIWELAPKSGLKIEINVFGLR